MKNFKSKLSYINTSKEDDFLYIQLINLFNQIKITQGGTELSYTLRNHPNLKYYAMKKQLDKIKETEEKYFNSDGTLDSDVIHESFLSKGSLHQI